MHKKKLTCNRTGQFSLLNDYRAYSLRVLFGDPNYAVFSLFLKFVDFLLDIREFLTFYSICWSNSSADAFNAMLNACAMTISEELSFVISRLTGREKKFKFEDFEGSEL